MRLSAALDGREVHSLDERMTLLNIVETPPALTFQTEDRPAAPGAAVTAVHTGPRLVTLVLCVRERDPVRRQRLTDALTQWAQGRSLRISTRPGRVLSVRCVNLPAISALGWTEEVRLTFAAMECPYWRSEQASRLAFTSAAWSGSLTAEGTAPCPVEAELTPDEGAVSQVSLAVGDTAAVLTGLDLQAGQTLRLSVEDGWLLRMTVDRNNGVLENLLSVLAPASDDLLMAAPGENAVLFSADAPVRVRLSARGCWL